MNMKLLVDKLKLFDKKIFIMTVIFIIAVIFVLLPASSTPKKTQTVINMPQIKNEAEKQLGERLSKIVGVNKAWVSITYLDDGVIEYQTDDKVSTKNDNENNKKSSLQTQLEKKTVFDGGKNIIVKSRKMPEIKGVCVFFDGDNNEKTVENLYNAVKGSLGIELYKIEVIPAKK